jgi:type II secretory pathway component PulF
MIDAGLTLAHSLRILEAEAPPEFAEAAEEMRSVITTRDVGMAEVMQARPELFPVYYVRVIRMMCDIGGVPGIGWRFLADLLEEAWGIGRLPGHTRRVNWLYHPNPSSRLGGEDWSDLGARERTFVLMLFCRSLSVMLAAGVPGRTALEEVAELLPATQRAAVREAAQGDMKSGVAERLGAIGFLPYMVTQMMEVGEHDGAFDQMMARAADVYERELKCLMM